MLAYRTAGEAGVEHDGLLDEAVWAQAQPITEFRQQEPVEGGVPSERTEIRVLYDDKFLYIGAKDQWGQRDLILIRMGLSCSDKITLN